MHWDKAFKPKNIKFFWICCFRMAVFQNLSHIPDQTNLNQSTHIGILHFAEHSHRAYQKKFRSLGQMEAEIKCKESPKFEKWQF